jgi:hypothetical protein
LKRTLTRLAALAVFALGAGPAAAQSWPTRAHHAHRALRRGRRHGRLRAARWRSSSTTSSRCASSSTTAPGAGGNTGAAAAAKAEPDGYTFFVGATHHVIAPAMYPNLTYDLEKDFVPIGMVSQVPHVVVVHPPR